MWDFSSGEDPEIFPPDQETDHLKNGSGSGSDLNSKGKIFYTFKVGIKYFFLNIQIYIGRHEI